MKLFTFTLLLVLVTSCQQNSEPASFEPLTSNTATRTDSVSSTSTISPTQTEFLASTITITPTETPQPLVSEITLPSETATLVVARPEGYVLEQASCRYGPGAAYLFEWGLYPGDYVRILNINVDGLWVFVKPRSYNNECWVKRDLLDTRGNFDSLEEYYSPLPQGYLYKPTHYVVATRNGNEVLVEWEPVWMTEDDDRGYLIEAWVCQNGKYIFLPVNIFPYTKTFTRIIDEPGCQQESKAQIFTVEKHGYIMPSVNIPWPKNP